jgi:hypothetical protein
VPRSADPHLQPHESVSISCSTAASSMCLHACSEDPAISRCSQCERQRRLQQLMHAYRQKSARSLIDLERVAADNSTLTARNQETFPFFNSVRVRQLCQCIPRCIVLGAVSSASASASRLDVLCMCCACA